MTEITEQHFLDKYYPNDNTKTINDLIRSLTEKDSSISEDELKEKLKTNFPNGNWSF